MNVTSQYETIYEPSGTSNFGAVPSADSRTPLELLIHLLAGSTDATLADSGITRLSREHLDAVSAHASHESEACLDRALLLLRLLEHTLEHGCVPTPSELLTMSQQITCMLQDHERWHTLADNAAYYRDYPQVAARIAELRFKSA